MADGRWPVTEGLQYREDVQDTAAAYAGHDLANNKEMSEDYLRDGMAWPVAHSR